MNLLEVESKDVTWLSSMPVNEKCLAASNFKDEQGNEGVG
jgi:hypothetical protein